MIKHAVKTAMTAALLLFAGRVEANDKEPSFVIQMGGAGEWELQHGSGSFGPAAALEYTLIKHWLELEVGVTPLFSSGKTEIGTDLIFKKPFELSKSLEFLIGAGPQWIHRTGENPRDSVAGDIMVEFVYSPWPERHAGFFLEPKYSYDFGKEHEQSFGVMGGLHIGIR
jgi:hypothetical protein